MQYRVDELARAAGVGVDTVRFYQTRGLLPPPERRGRVAVYSAEHLERLRRIRELNRQGLKLEAVGRLLASEGMDGEAEPHGGLRSSLLRALEQSEADEPVYSRAELESSARVPGFLIAALEEVGLIAAQRAGRYGAADRDTLESARVLLDVGLPFAELLALARSHVEHVDGVAERAVALFEAHLRARDAEHPDAPLEIAERFGRLLPAVTRLVAVHFERALVTRARARLQDLQA